MTAPDGPRPPCPQCAAGVERTQRTMPGGTVCAVFAAYPCGCWLTGRQAHQLRARRNELTAHPGGPPLVVAGAG